MASTSKAVASIRRPVEIIYISDDDDDQPVRRSNDSSPGLYDSDSDLPVSRLGDVVLSEPTCQLPIYMKKFLPDLYTSAHCLYEYYRTNPKPSSHQTAELNEWVSRRKIRLSNLCLFAGPFLDPTAGGLRHIIQPCRALEGLAITDKTSPRAHEVLRSVLVANWAMMLHNVTHVVSKHSFAELLAEWHDIFPRCFLVPGSTFDVVPVVSGRSSAVFSADSIFQHVVHLRIQRVVAELARDGSALSGSAALHRLSHILCGYHGYADTLGTIRDPGVVKSEFGQALDHSVPFTPVDSLDEHHLSLHSKMVYTKQVLNLVDRVKRVGHMRELQDHYGRDAFLRRFREFILSTLAALTATPPPSTSKWGDNGSQPSLAERSSTQRPSDLRLN